MSYPGNLVFSAVTLETLKNLSYQRLSYFRSMRKPCIALNENLIRSLGSDQIKDRTAGIHKNGIQTEFWVLVRRLTHPTGRGASCLVI
jgi:hypothetical protein